MIDELQTLMSFYSVTSDQNAVGQLLDYVGGRLKTAGLTVERFEHNGIKSLYASTNNTHRPRVLLQGHIDIVPGKDQPFRITDTIIHGRGCYDMLYGTASFLRLFDTLEDIRQYSIGIMLTGDEEIGGENGVEALLKSGEFGCDICILPDAGEGIGSMNVAAKGIYQVQIQVNGASHHASRPWEGDGAAAKIIRLLSELAESFDTSDKANSTLTVSQLSAGSDALNQGPSIAQAGLDIRFKDQTDFARIQQVLGSHLEKYDATITFEHTGSNYELDLTQPLVTSFIKTYASITGAPIRYTRAHGSSDARFFAERNIPVIMFRPDGSGAHGDDEQLSLPSWETFYNVLETYVRKVANISKV